MLPINSLAEILISAAERGWMPDALIRLGIRRLLSQRLHGLANASRDSAGSAAANLACELADGPLAVETDAANEQHYEVPAEFFEQALGPRLKYSCCLFDRPGLTLAEAEEAMLRETCQRAEIADGMQILELGCGWGSLSLWMAEQFRESNILAISNSASQRAFITSKVQQQGLRNLQVITADMRQFETNQQFDRVVSVEMFEHMRNYDLLFQRIADWLNPGGKLFAHIFCHRDTPYLFETAGPSDWMARHFFTGGTMPSDDLFDHFDRDLSIERRWRVNGRHYWQTCEAWLENLDRNRPIVVRRFERDLDPAAARRWLQRWRIFFMACAELFRHGGGNQWFVAHYLMNSTRRRHARRTTGRMKVPAQTTATTD